MDQKNLQTITCNSIDDLDKAASLLLTFCNDSRIVLFSGSMGAGKTTFIKAVCKMLGVQDSTGSPTFSIVNEYHTVDNNKIYHFDFYRLKNEYEALDIGFEEYLDSGAYCFIEWPEKVSSLLPDLVVEVSIDVQEESRIITIKKEEI